MKDTFLLVLFIAPTPIFLYGVIHSFQYHSDLMGTLSFIIPPLGFIMGVEGMFH